MKTDPTYNKGDIVRHLPSCNWGELRSKNRVVKITRVYHRGESFFVTPIRGKGVGKEFVCGKADIEPLKVSVERSLNILILGRPAPIRKAINGALKSCIDAHGPIGSTQITSASKRVFGALKTMAKRGGDL